MMNLMMRMMNRVLPSCEEVSHLSSRAMDESLPLGRRIALRLHLMMCIWCNRSARQLRLLRRMARTAPSAEDNGHLSPEARERIAARLKQARDESSPA